MYELTQNKYNNNNNNNNNNNDIKYVKLSFYNCWSIITGL